MTQEAMEQRITNLEVALQGMWALLKYLQPLATQESIDSMMSDLFEANSSALADSVERILM